MNNFRCSLNKLSLVLTGIKQTFWLQKTARVIRAYIYICTYQVYNILISAKILQNNRILQSAADTKFFTSQNMKLISILDELGTKQ